MHKLGIEYELMDEPWTGEYRIQNTRIWDSARRLEKDMYVPGSMKCLSFGHGKPLHIGRGGAILLDNPIAYKTMLAQRYDGRDLTVSPWESQNTFHVGYHYKPTIEEAELGIVLMKGIVAMPPEPIHVVYPDLRQITIRD